MLKDLNLKTIIIGSITSVALSSLIIGLRHQGSFEQIELLAYDFLVRQNAESSSDERITIVGIDDNSLRQLNSDKISDGTLKQVLETIDQYQPKVIGVDIIRDVPIGEGRTELFDYIDNRYQTFAGAIKPIIFSCALPSTNKPNGIAPPDVVDPDSAVGYVDLETDPQNIFGAEVVRRSSISSIPVNLGKVTVPEERFDAESKNYLCNAPFSFGFLTSLSYVQATEFGNLLPEITPDVKDFLDLTKITEGEIGFKSLILQPLQPKTGSYQSLDPTVYQQLIDYRYTQPGKIISLTKVLNQQIAPEDFQDKLVLIGYVTKQDLHQTPFGLRPGVVIHGWIASQLLSNVLDRQPQIWTWSEPIEWLWILAWGIAGTVLALTIRPVELWLGGQVIAIAIIGTSCWWLFTQQGWIPLIPSLFSFAIASTAVKIIAFKLEPKLEPKEIAPVLPLSEDKTDLQKEEGMLDSRYQIVRFLGKGGFGKTYLAEDTKRPNRPLCVVKQLSPGIDNPEFLAIARRLFFQEAETLEKVGIHDQIPRLLANFTQDQEFYLVQEYIEGRTLTQELLSNQTWSEVEVIFLLYDCLNILKFIHDHGVIHRDIKPDNLIRRSQDNKMILVDFGSVKEVIMSQTPTVTPTIAVGTRGYMPTEQAVGKPHFTSDLYALGIIAIQALTGTEPLRFQLDEKGEIISQWQAQCSEKLKEILTKMTRSNAQERYQSAAEILADLHELDTHLELLTSQPDTIIQDPTISNMQGYQETSGEYEIDDADSYQEISDELETVAEEVSDTLYYPIRERGAWGDEEVGEDGEVWGDGEDGEDGEVWGDGEMGRWRCDPASATDARERAPLEDGGDEDGEDGGDEDD